MIPSGLPVSQSQECRSLPWSYGYMHGRPGRTCMCRVTCSLVLCHSAPGPGRLCSCSTGAQQQQTTPSHGTGEPPGTEQGPCADVQLVEGMARVEMVVQPEVDLAQAAETCCSRQQGYLPMQLACSSSLGLIMLFDHLCPSCLCRTLPLAVEPVSGRLGPAGSPDSSTAIDVSIAPTEPGATVSELTISTAGGKEPLVCPLGASVVQSSYQLIDDTTKTAVPEVCRLLPISPCPMLGKHN
jgi:hypothetical protein